MRLVFLGAGAFGIPSLEHLAREHEIALVVTQPDRPAGRGKVLGEGWVGWATAPHALLPRRSGRPPLSPRSRLPLSASLPSHSALSRSFKLKVLIEIFL